MADETTLADLLLAWEEMHEQGQEMSAEELARSHPHLLSELSRRIDALKAVRWVRQVRPSCCSTAAVVDGSAWTTEEPVRKPGQVLAGRYRLDQRIAEGGFGHVWQAYDLQLNKAVAVKIAKRHRISGPEQLEAFLEEARKAKRLSHEGIVPILDVGQDGDAYFHVSELIDGSDLASLIRKRRLNPPEAASMGLALARALDYAHQNGIVHRDVKPANVLVDGRGRPFLTDFGISVTAQQLQQGLVDCSGTLAYMAPEQAVCDSSRIDPRTDVYAVGVLLYEMLAGRPPFQSLTPTALREQVLSRQPPPLTSAGEAVPEVLEAICRKCLAKSADDRYQTADALAAELEAFLTTV